MFKFPESFVGAMVDTGAGERSTILNKLFDDVYIKAYMAALQGGKHVGTARDDANQAMSDYLEDFDQASEELDTEVANINGE